MFSFAAATIALSAFSSVSAHVVPRHRNVPRLDTPSTYDETNLESYATYHARYLALGCQYNHGNDFFDACCHPLQKDQSLSSLEARCTPDAAVLSSINASIAGVATSSAVAVSSSQVAAPVTEAAPTTTSTTEAATTTWTPEEKVAAATTSTWSSQAAATTSASSSSSANLGGFGTFFYQNGVAGACGTVHGDYDVVVAIDQDQFSQSICGKSVTITNTANQKTVTAVVADMCPTCTNSNSIDMSLGAFLAIGEMATGQLDISWVWA